MLKIQMKRLTGIGLTIVVAAVLAGCGSADKPAPETARVPDPLTWPPLSEPLPPLDDGRVSVSPPAHWEAVAGGPALLRLRASNREVFPEIVLTVADYKPLGDVTAENVGKFAGLVHDELQAESRRRHAAGEGDGLLNLASPVEVFRYGNLYGVTYARRRRTPDAIFEQHIVETVRNGRRYAIELREFENAAERWRPHLFAVAAAMQFLTPEKT